MEGWQLLKSIQRLPTSMTVDFKHPKAVRSSQLQPEILDEIKKYNATAKHFFKDSTGNVYLLEQYGAKYCIYWPAIGCNVDDLRQSLSKQSKAGSKGISDCKSWNAFRFEELLSLWNEDPDTRSLNAPIKLNLKVTESSVGETKNYHNVLPEDYLETKYYESLFFTHIPLAYFLKSNLERLKRLCKSTSTEESNNAYRKCISDMLLENKHFDKRHKDGNILKNGLHSATSVSKRNACLEKFGLAAQAEADRREKNDLCMILRVREVKLQIIMLLERIYMDGLDAGFKDFEAKYLGKLKTRSLNLTKLIPRRFKRDRSFPPERKETEGDFDCCEQLDLYLDKLCILDVLLASESNIINTTTNLIEEQKRNMLNKNKEASSLGFTNYVLIPYFSGKTPYAVRFIIRKLKGPSLRNRKPLRRKDTLDETVESSAGQIDQTSITISSPNLDPQLSSRPPSPSFRRPSTGLPNARSSTTELVDLRSNSSIDEFLEANTTNRRNPSLLSRTSSDLTMTHLQRRQLSVTEFTSQKPVSNYSNDPNSIKNLSGPSLSSQQSFRRVGKRKGLHPISRSISAIDSEVNLVQVMGTPLKKDETPIKKRAKLHNIVESPMNSLNGNANTETTTEQRADQEKTIRRPGTSNRKVRRKLFAP